jgi:hypothetical protein
MFTFFNEHPSELADLAALRAEHPGLMRLESLAARDRVEALNTESEQI